MSDSRLFRDKFYSVSSNDLGDPTGIGGLPPWGITLLLTSIVAIFVIYLSMVTYARRETVMGTVEPGNGTVRISAPKTATISDIHVRVGDRVKSGQPLFSLSADAVLSDGRRLSGIYAEGGDRRSEALERRIDAQRRFSAYQTKEYESKRRSLVSIRDRIGQDITLQTERIRLSKENVEAALQLVEGGLVSKSQLRQRRENLLAQELSLSSLLRERDDASFALEQLEAQQGRAKSESDAAAATLAGSQADAAESDAQKAAETSTIISAPDAGMVVALQAVRGAPATPGTTLALLVPSSSRLQAQLWLPSSAIGFVRPGNQVRLMYDAFPHQRFGFGQGRVVEVAGAPVQNIDAPPKQSKDEAAYRVIVEIDEPYIHAYGREWTISPGMRLKADVILERQSMMSWMLDKIRITGRFVRY